MQGSKPRRAERMFGESEKKLVLQMLVHMLCSSALSDSRSELSACKQANAIVDCIKN